MNKNQRTMEKINKTNEQLQDEFEQALQTLSEKLYNLLHYGNYKLDRVSRDFSTNRVSFASMTVGKHHLILEDSKKESLIGEGSQVTLSLPDNPVNEQVLEIWERATIQNDIDFYNGKLEKLMKIKAELGI